MHQSDDLKLAIEAAKKGAEIIKNGYGKSLEITVKDNNAGVVTQIDHQSEEIIIKILQQHSSYPILAEESGKTGEVKDTFWVIDPLDGTRNFSRGIPIFAVAIALVKNNQIVLGVTLNPLTGDLYYAERSQGAYLNDQQIHVSSRSSEIVMVFNKGYTEESTTKLRAAVDKLAPFSVVRSLGSSAMELCWVAQGAFEGFICFGDQLWDDAAGVILIREASGKVTDWAGNEWDIKNPAVLATNGLIHQKIIENL